MRLLICGSRTWDDIEIISEELGAARNVDVVIDGAALGADSLAHRAAKDLNIPTLRFPADWKTHGNAAGPIRNQQMLDEGKPTEVWCFTEDRVMSPGTQDMFDRAKAAGLPIRHYYLELKCDQY